MLGETLGSPLVSIVIVNHNGKKHLRTCLKSIAKIRYPSFETILVDNMSTDGSVEFVRKNFKWVKVIENDTIIYPAGNNVGVENSRGKYVAFLNNDTEVDPNWLKELVKVMENEPKVAACTCKVKLFSNRSLINSAGMECDVYGFAFSRGLICRGKFEKDAGQYDEVKEVFATYSAAMIIRREVFRKINGFNADFGFHYEEIDLSWRARLAGYNILYVPTAVVYHKTGGAKTSYTRRKRYYIEKNRLRTMVQNYSLPMFLRVLPIYSFLKFSEILLYIFFRKIREMSEIGGGILSNVKNLHKILKDRHKVQKKIRKVPDEKVVKHMKRYSHELRMFLKGYGKFVLR